MLIEHLQQLLAYKQVDKPVYDYTLHTRSEEIIPVEPKDVIILEGILILEDPRLCELMDIKLFVDTDATFVSCAACSVILKNAVVRWIQLLINM